MRNTSLCYLENGGKYLMLHRIKKENDENHDKWIGIGGKFEERESPQDCALREIQEETGIRLESSDLKYRGIVTFVSSEWGTEYMHLFTAALRTEHMAEIRSTENDEGSLAWVPVRQVLNLPIWEGDKIFLRLLSENSPFFSLKLEYEGDLLVRHTLYPC